jgi:hypothetical protein
MVTRLRDAGYKIFAVSETGREVFFLLLTEPGSDCYLVKNPDLAAGAVPSLAGQHARWADFSFHGRNSANGIHALVSENPGKPRRPRPVQIACHEWRRLKAVVIAGWMNKLNVNSPGQEI